MVCAFLNPMAINPLDMTSTPSPERLIHRTLPGDVSHRNRSFAERMAAATGVLQQGTSKNNVDAAAAAAEIMRLEMMKSALSIGSGEASSTTPLSFSPAKLVIDKILEGGQQIDNTPSKKETTIASIIPQQASPPPATLQDVISKASKQHGVEESLIKAVIKAESNFNPNAVSRAGAQGLMQLMPSTARGLGVTNSFDPEQNIMAGTRFLKDMLKRYQGNVDAALADYNWGPGNVDRKGISSLPKETREYLAKVKTYYNQYVG